MSGNNSGWNRPAANQPTVKKGGYPPAKQPEGAARRGAKAPSKVRGIVAGLVTVCALGGLCLWMFSGGEDAPKAKPEKERGRIKAVTPVVVRTNVAAVATSDAPEELSEDARLLQGKDTNKWIVVKDPRTGKKYASRLLNPGPKNLPPPYFSHHSLNVIDALMHKDMSDTMFAVQIDENFLQDFQNALLEDLTPSADDNEDRVAHKVAMKETLKNLKAAIKGGADLRDILNDELKERRRVAALKDMMKEERARMRDNGDDEESVVEFERACNKKLEELGSSPIPTRELMRQKAREYQERKAKGQN